MAPSPPPRAHPAPNGDAGSGGTEASAGRRKRPYPGVPPGPGALPARSGPRSLAPPGPARSLRSPALSAQSAPPLARGPVDHTSPRGETRQKRRPQRGLDAPGKRGAAAQGKGSPPGGSRGPCASGRFGVPGARGEGGSFSGVGRPSWGGACPPTGHPEGQPSQGQVQGGHLPAPSHS